MTTIEVPTDQFYEAVSALIGAGIWFVSSTDFIYLDTERVR